MKDNNVLYNSLNIMKSYRILNFTYDGFGGRLTQGYADYTAVFKEWTTDPGIALMACSDGQERRIPGWAIEGWNKDSAPEQDMTEAKQMVKAYGGHIGQPSHS